MSLRDIAIEIADSYECMYLFLGIFSLIIKEARKNYRWLLFFLISVGSIRVVSIFLAENGSNTIPIYHVIGLLELLILYKVYCFSVSNNIWKWMVFLICTVYILNSLFFQSIWEMNGLMQAVVQLFVFGLSTNYLFSIHRKSNQRQGGIPVFFYANAGFMFYATGSFMVFLINERIIIGVTSDLFDNAWLVEAGFGVIRLVFIGITLRLTNGK